MSFYYHCISFLFIYGTILLYMMDDNQDNRNNHLYDNQDNRNNYLYILISLLMACFHALSVLHIHFVMILCIRLLYPYYSPQIISFSIFEFLLFCHVPSSNILNVPGHPGELGNIMPITHRTHGFTTFRAISNVWHHCLACWVLLGIHFNCACFHFNLSM